MWAELMLALGKTGELKARGATRGVWLFEALDFHPKNIADGAPGTCQKSGADISTVTWAAFFFDFFGALDIEMSEIEAFFECLILVILNPWQA